MQEVIPHPGVMDLVSDDCLLARMLVMSTRHASSQRLDATVAADVRVRRPASRGMEVYGSETLPVLLHLPDLTKSMAGPQVPATLKEQSRPADWHAAADTAVSTTVPDDDSDQLLADTVAAVAAAPMPTEAEPLTRTPLRMRRKMQARQTDGWLSGLRRFLVATIIAGVLFAVIITIKEWNQAPAPQAQRRTMAVEATNVDLGPPELNAAGILPYDNHPALLRPDSEPALGSDETPRPIDPREIDPSIASGEFSVDAPSISPPNANAFGSFEGEAKAERMRAIPDTDAGVVDGASPTASAAPGNSLSGGYPRTGVDAMPGQSVGSGAWPRGTVPPQPVWNAERAPADGRFPPR